MIARLFMLVVLVTLLATAARGDETREAKIGLPVRFDDVVIPGTEVEGLPHDPKAPFEARVVATRPHGTALRYDIECVAFEAGTFDARDVLKRKDGTPLTDAPALAFVVSSALEPGLVRPHTPGEGHVPAVGGYTTWLVVAGCVWVLGLVWFFVTARTKRRAAAGPARPRQVTLVERLRVLVERARDQELGDFERTQLEMSLVAYWRRRLGHEKRPASELLPILRAHPEAGPLLTGLERWLHAPPGAHEVDVAALLAPYRDLPEDAIELPTPG